MGYDKGNPAEKDRVHGREKWHYNFRLNECVDIKSGSRKGQGGFVVARAYDKDTKRKSYEVELDRDQSRHWFSEKTLSEATPKYAKGQRVFIVSDNSLWQGQRATVLKIIGPKPRYRFNYEVEFKGMSGSNVLIKFPFIERSLGLSSPKTKKKLPQKAAVYA